jgi:hypothetical protein
MVVGGLMLPNVGAQHTDMMVESIQAIETEQLHKVVEKRGLSSPETVIIHMGTNDLRKTEILILCCENYMRCSLRQK